MNFKFYLTLGTRCLQKIHVMYCTICIHIPTVHILCTLYNVYNVYIVDCTSMYIRKTMMSTYNTYTYRFDTSNMFVKRTRNKMM